MANLRTDYKDDVLDTSVNTQRKYQMIENEDETVSFVDVTEYLQEGDRFGAADVNVINEAISELNSGLTSKLGHTLVKTGNTNLNDYTDYGIYYFPSDYKPTNIPAGENGWLIVLAGQTVKQIWLRRGTAGSNDHHIWTRSLLNNSTTEWSDWVRFFTTKDIIPIANGGTGATTATTALTNLGITSTAAELNKLDGVTATTAELNYLVGVTSKVQTQLNAKATQTALNALSNVAFQSRRALEESEDLNDVITQGTYTATTDIAATLSNTYYKNMFFMNVFTRGSYIVQEQYRNGIAGYRAFRVRRTDDDSWYDWAEVATTSNLNSYLPKSGGIISGNIYPSVAGSVNMGTSSNYWSGVFTGHVGNRKGELWMETDSAVYVRDESGAYKPMYASVFNMTSSRKVKENIADITEEEAKKLLDINVVSFDYIEKIGGAKNQYGVIAEDVYEQIPYVVTMPEDYDESSDDITHVPAVDYSRFVPYLIKMVQMQQKEIEELKEKIGSEVKNEDS